MMMIFQTVSSWKRSKELIQRGRLNQQFHKRFEALNQKILSNAKTNFHLKEKEVANQKINLVGMICAKLILVGTTVIFINQTQIRFLSSAKRSFYNEVLINFLSYFYSLSITFVWKYIVKKCIDIFQKVFEDLLIWQYLLNYPV